MNAAVLLLTMMSGPMLEPAEVPVAEYLWPDGAPGAIGDEEADKPCVFVYHPSDDVDTGAAIVLCPGGGYAVHAMDHEGHHVARFFQSHGVTVALLRYRLGERYRHPSPLNDVSRALRFVRENGPSWGVDPSRVGVMGFSAGGHLASTVSTHYTGGNAGAADPIERQSSRPDFSILCYPVVSLVASYSHRGSGNRLLGPAADEAVREELSNDLHVTEDTPPAFLFQTSQDPAVPAQNSLAYAMACADNGVPCELHMFRYGPHGVGMALIDPAASQWRDLALTWMRQSGFLVQGERAAVTAKVTFNGEVVSAGEVSFYSDDANAPVPSARFGRGQFKFSETDGPLVGKAKVRILHTGNVKPAPTLETPVDITPELIEVVIKPGANTFQFDLTSD